MKNAFKTVLLCSTIALMGTSVAAQIIQPLEGDGTQASQTPVFDPQTGALIGFLVAGVFVAAASAGGGGGGGGGNDTPSTTNVSD